MITSMLRAIDEADDRIARLGEEINRQLQLLRQQVDLLVAIPIPNPAASCAYVSPQRRWASASRVWRPGVGRRYRLPVCRRRAAGSRLRWRRRAVDRSIADG